MPLDVPHFSGGRESVRAKLNQLVDAVNGLRRVTGDGLILVNHGPTGFTIRLAVDQLIARIPRPQGGAGEVLFGKPTGAFSSGTTMTLDPCDIHGTDNGLGNRTVYVQASQASYSMTNSTTVPVTEIVPYAIGNDGNFYALGHPTEAVTNMQYDTSSHKLQKKTRNTWGSFCGTESDWVDVTTAVDCTGV